MQSLHPHQPELNSKAKPTITPVILCGGSGTRLWPLSRQSFPKQFVPLIEGHSLLSLTLERLKRFSPQMVLLAAEDHRFLLADALKDAHCFGDLVLEPFARNTAPAMAMAALWLASGRIAIAEGVSSGTDLLLFCPSDHHIPDHEAFQRTIEAGVQAAQNGAIVTFGVEPTSPSSAYGYIHQGPRHESLLPHSNTSSADVSSAATTDSTSATSSATISATKSASTSARAPNDGTPRPAPVLGFVEKPALDVAQSYVLSGEYLWNAGIFLTRADTLLNALKARAPEILDACEKAMAQAPTETLPTQEPGAAQSMRFVRPKAQALEVCPSESIDYAVMEHHHPIVVVSFQGQWSDVGSWTAVADLTPQDHNGNHIVGSGFAHESRNTFIHAPHRTVVTLGVDDLLVVDTPDALLVAHRDHAQGVKTVVAALEKNKDPKAVLHRQVHRPWGWYDSIDQGERFQVKRICVKAGASLSLQKHHHRAEHWIVVKGCAEVTKGQEVFLLGENQSTYIPIGEVHRLHNPGVTELEMIEVQSGSYLGEDDIVRLEDTYGRIKDTLDDQ